MALVLADRVKETTTTTGTGTVTLAGAATGYQSFTVGIGDGNTTYYAISGGTEWEVGIGTYTASGTTLSRTTVLSSSNGGSLVSFSSGSKDVICTYPAAKAIAAGTGCFTDQFTGSYTDGVVIDHVTGFGRITVGTADSIQFYTGGPSGTLLGEALASGAWDFNGSVSVGTGTHVGGATNPLMEASGSTNQYVQVYVHNDSSGASASSDFAAYPDNGTDTSGWVDMGITSSAYSDANYPITGANEGYVFMSAVSGSGKTGNLVFATDSTGTANAFQWYVGGFNQAKSAYKMQLNGTALTLAVPITSTVTTGTAPFTVASTTQVANLNAAAAGMATNIASGAANQIPYQTGSGATSFITAPTTGSTSLTWNGSAFVWAAAGGGGSVAGSNTQIQYNNAGAFGASANFTYDASTNTLSLLGTDPSWILNGITTEPTAPAAGTLEIYAKSIAGRMLPKWVGPSGFDTPFQAAISQNKVAWWNPPGNATTVPGVLGIAAPTSIGTATARNVATTNVFTRARRLGYNSAGTAGQAGGHFLGTAQYTTGAGGGVGGFYYVCRFGSADTLAQAIMFVGMSSSTATPTVTASPATFTNSIGVGCATGDTNLSIYYGGSAAQTPIALGASFPAKTNSTDLYELVLFSSSATATSVGYRVTNITSGAQASGTLTAATAGTQLPASTTLLAHRAYRSNNATATAVLIDIVSVYIETDT
jgi:hypothetical protein